jgi:hypothetical protein
LVTTYQAGKLVMVRDEGDLLNGLAMVDGEVSNPQTPKNSAKGV